MAKILLSVLACAIFALFMISCVLAAPLLDANEIGFGGQSRGNNYDALIDAYFSNSHVVTAINNNNDDMLWVPWYKTSSSSHVADLQSGTNCDPGKDGKAGQEIDFSHNCMVTDEFSQIGILVSMGKNQTRMDQFYNTVIASKSTNGNLPSWRIYRDGNTIEACRQGINDNCDTASDADARIIIALFTASKNPYLADAEQKENYATLARKIADDMLTYEVDDTCRQTSFGDVCHWLAGGSNVKTAGIGASDFAYTGYYPDAIIAMLEAYANTNDMRYYDAAKDFTLNYLQAADFNNNTLSVPPGKSFKWVLDSNGIPQSQCTNTCSPIVWDGYDASRALGMCQANYYAKQMNVQLSNLQKYCDLLTQKYMTSTTSAPLQFYPDGTAASSQSGYFAQGLEALHLSGVDSALFKSSLDSALAHYAPSTKTFDYAPSIGVYTQSFAVRALGMGIGRDLDAFKLNPVSSDIAVSPDNASAAQNVQKDPQDIISPAISDLAAYCVYGTADTPATVKSDATSGSCRTVTFSTTAGDIKMFACKKDGGYAEIYRQAAPEGIEYKACLADGCIIKDNGFARFIPTTATQTTTATTTTTIAPSQTSTSTLTSEPIPIPTSTTMIQTYKGIASLSASCTYNSITCNIKSDVTSGTCRIIVFGTSSGDIQIQGCEKSGNSIEVYRQSYPGNLVFKACIGTGCVDNYGGFAKFRPPTSSITSTATTSTPVLSTSIPAAPQSQTSTAPTAYSISTLPITIQPSGTLVTDIMDGATCRKIQYNTQYGWNEAKVCAKDTTYEMYLLSSPNAASICVGNNCVGQNTGFVSFTY